jgi:uncharacterized membrane protein YhaH (DUF805 family)
MQIFTLKNKINVFSFLYLLLFLCLAFVCISFCHYYLYGDSQLYIADLCKLRGDYFPANFKALFSDSSNHISLKTEGGFSFALLPFYFINWELPFFVSAFFTVGFLAVLSLLSNEDKNKISLATFSTILVLLLIPRFASDVFMLSQCLRDSIAHFFGLLGFLLCIIGINKSGKMPLFWGAFCVGIACWCRIPNIIFIIPSGVYLLLSVKKIRIKTFCHSVLLMIVGLAIGLLPLFGQNILEGRPFYVAGQMTSLVLKTIPQKPQKPKNHTVQKKSVEQSRITKLVAKNLSKKDFSAVQKGMSLKNFSSTGKRLYYYVRGMFGRYVFWLFLLCTVIAVFINYRLALSLLSGSLSFFLFYSCYDKVVGRYTLIIPLLLLPMAALCVAKFIDLVIKLSKQQKHEFIIKQVIAGVVVSICLFLMISSAKGFKSLLQERKYCIEYKENLEKLFNKDDVYICYNGIINSWTSYLSGVENFRWLLSVSEHWEIYADKDAQFKKFDDKIQAGKNAFYIEMQSDDIPFKYWSKQDVNLHYEVNVVDDIAPMFDEYGKVIVSQITERNATERTIEYSMDSEKSTRLLLWTADASGIVPKIQHVVLSAGNISVTNQLSTGINLYDIPNDFFNKNFKLKVLSTTNLPIIIDATAFSTNATVVFQDYENMPATLTTLPGAKPFWFGRYHWGRESRKKGKYIDPLIALPQSSSFSVLTDGKIKMTLRFSTIGEIKSKKLLENLSKLILKNGDVDCPISIDVVKWSKRGSRRTLVADVSSDELISLNDVFEFEIDIKHADKASIFLESITF